LALTLGLYTGQARQDVIAGIGLFLNFSFETV